MANTIYGLTSYYYNIFKSPVETHKVNNVTNLMYNSIASRVYSQTFGKKAQSTMSSYLTALSSNINEMKEASKAFKSKGTDSSLSQKTVLSSDQNSAIGEALPNADKASYTLNVSKLATSQTNTGSLLNSKDDTSFTHGINTFTLDVGGNKKSVSFIVDIFDTNQTSLSNMAKAINYAKAGVTASVVSDSKTDTSFLKVVSDKTGTGCAFTLSDTKGNAVSISSIGTVSTQAQNAEYTINGKQHTSQENDLTINNGKVNVTLRKATGKDVKLDIDTDTNAIKSDIKDLIERFNSITKLTSLYSSDFKGAEKLGEEFSSIIRYTKSSLEDIGININADNTLSIDDKKLDKALSENLSRIQDVLAGHNGLADRLYSKSNEVLTSPLQYTKPFNINKGLDTFYNYLNSSNTLMSKQNIYSGLVLDLFL
ncbi:MAG: flagellar filament capping protein FliD [Clostridia bacterium]|nr:flagellar filament capping protein FliD [Clostridia bacterium]